MSTPVITSTLSSKTKPGTEQKENKSEDSCKTPDTRKIPGLKSVPSMKKTPSMYAGLGAAGSFKKVGSKEFCACTTLSQSV